jgi:hypothetical protein
MAEALSALVSKYLDAVIAAEESEIEGFFGNLVPRSKLRDAIKALLAARELSFERVGHRTLIEIAHGKTALPGEPIGGQRDWGSKARLGDRSVQRGGSR